MRFSSRHLADVSVFLILAAACWLTWQYGHALDPAVAPISLKGTPPSLQVLNAPGHIHQSADTGALTLVAVENAGKPCAEIPLSSWRGRDSAHIRIRSRAHELQRGENEWDIGRIALVWRDAGGKILPGNYGISGVFDNMAQEVTVIADLDKTGTPSILLQNLAKSGTLTIEQLEIHPVQWRWWVPWVALTVVLSAIALTTRLFRRAFGSTSPGWLRPILAAMIYTVTGWCLIFPGPWRPLRPIILPFEIGCPTAAAPEFPAQSAPPNGPHRPDPALSQPPGAATVTPPEPLVVHEEIPGKMDAGWFWESFFWVKAHLRTFLHLAIFSSLAFVFRILLGSHRVWMPLALLAAGSEAMQFLFGFGFLREDVADLALDATGIALGLWLSTLPLAKKLPLLGRCLSSPLPPRQ